MKKLISMVAILACVPFATNASDLSSEISNVRRACAGISAEMAGMKRMAGINTAITGAGTVAGGVALGTGIAKVGVDKQVAEWEKVLADLEQDKNLDEEYTLIDLAAVRQALKEKHKADAINMATGNVDELTAESKSLGNIRTGTMAGATAANIAGAVIAGGNKVKGDLQSKIDECIVATKILANVRMQARMDGTADAVELQRAENIVSACSAWELVDLSKIDNRATGAMVSSAIGATTGLAGTITSASANSDAVRTGDDQKEKNLNTASNILAGTTTVASGAATVFNTTQIGAIKRAATVADNCEGALK